jgi:pSer/pThr/pTyr-binding forkhead associated (FHA) protein
MSMLFLPPRPPLRLPTDGPLVIGRSRSCQLRLPSGDASRRHAEILATADGYQLRDLGSTNGTFVNGEPVKDRLLRPGDRIEIAGSSITFCQIAANPAVVDTNLGEAKTILVDRPVAAEVFRGELSEIPAFAVLQTLELGYKTGALQFDSADGEGRLWLSKGRPVHAEAKALTGFDAAIALVHTESGRFSFEPDSAPPEYTIEASVTELLLEAARELDESLS